MFPREQMLSLASLWIGKPVDRDGKPTVVDIGLVQGQAQPHLLATAQQLVLRKDTPDANSDMLAA